VHPSNVVASSVSSVSVEGKHVVEKQVEEPSIAARYTCASIMIGIFAVWGKYAFVDESEAPGVNKGRLHDYKFPLLATSFYLISLPILSRISSDFNQTYMKLLLKESMVVYNAGQVLLNGWMVYRYLDAVFFHGHPFVGDLHTVHSGATFAVWIHYCDKYLEFFDTYFMVLRGRMDQVSFLHVYHHTSIAWAWWAGLTLWPGGDSYFGALLNSFIHVLMYSYYTLSLLRIACPWKKYLTFAQLVQFTSVIVYSGFSVYLLPEEANWKPYTALAIQCIEMSSLFVLFFLFYKKTYKSSRTVKEVSKPRNNKSSSTDSDTVTSDSSISSTNSNAEKEQN